MKKIALATLVGNLFAEELGISLLTQILRDKGFEVDIFHFKQREQMIETLLMEQYEVVCFNLYHVNVTIVNEVAQIIKKTNGSKIIYGGHFASDNFNEILNKYDFVDYITLGESEITIVKLMNYILKGQGNIEDIKGIAYKKSGTIYYSRAIHVANLDQLPFACRDIAKKNQLNFAYIEGSRGCTGTCTFCSNCKIPYRQKSISKVVEEIKSIIQTCGIKTFIFSDCSWDNPNNDITRVNDLCSRLICENIKAHYFMFFKSPVIRVTNDKFWSNLINTGVFTVFIGVESFVQDELELFSKQATVEDNIDILSKLMEYKYLIHTQVGVIFFHPYSTIENMKINNYYLCKFKKALQFQQLNNMEIYNNTKMLNLVKKDNLHEPKDFNFSEYRFKDVRVESLYQFVSIKFAEKKYKGFIAEINGYFRFYYDFLILQMQEEIWKNDKKRQSVIKTSLDEMFQLGEKVNEISYKLFDDLLDLAESDWNEKDATKVVNKYLGEEDMANILKRIRKNRLMHSRRVAEVSR